MTTNINWDFISSLEGKGVKQAYVPSENSGVTIATGFDLKEKNAELLAEMGISEETTSLLSKFFGMSGAQATEASKGFSLNDEQVAEIDKASHQWYANQVKKTYESKDHEVAWDDLSEAMQTVIASVGFQHGTSFTRKDGSEMNYIKQARANDIEGMIANLRDFGDAFDTRRNKEADLLENEKKTLDKQFKPVDITKQKYLWSEDPDVSKGLFLDSAYNYSELQKHIAEGRTISNALKASLRENTIFANSYDLFANPTFVQEEGFSWENNQEEFQAAIKEYNLNPEFADSLIGALNGEHLKYLAEKAARHQANAELLASYGWGGIALQFGTFK
jgi:GH24 family phage-related lysozyme (muramidase)